MGPLADNIVSCELIDFNANSTILYNSVHFFIFLSEFSEKITVVSRLQTAPRLQIFRKIFLEQIFLSPRLGYSGTNSVKSARKAFKNG